MSDPSIIAADPTRSAWVAANAGAGKTYTLANRVTRLLLAGTRPEKILCLTYTKAAAAEMQGRLFAQLGKWSMLPDVELAESIGAIGAEAGSDLRKARRLFAQALETPGGLKILTIHAFCQNVLSRFPLEAGVPASFDVLDDQTARALMAGARGAVLETAEARGLTQSLGFLLTHMSDLTLGEFLDAALGADRRKFERFFETLAGADVATAVRRAHGADALRDAETIVYDFCAGLDAARLTAWAEWLDGGSETNRKAATQLRQTLRMSPSSAMYAATRSFLLTDKGEARKSVAIKALVTARPDLEAQIRALQQDIIAVEEQRRAAYAAALAEAVLRVAEAVHREYVRAKLTRGVLDYDDLIVKTQRLLERSNAAAWVLYKLDGGIEHVLIDEAQDTSPEQWRIVKALTAEFFAGRGLDDARGVTRTIFAVGDEKQSIFSFQGADPAQFDLHRKFFHDAALASEHHFVQQPLTQSRRSVPQVLTFVDAVFQAEEARAGLTSDGAALHHEAHRADARGRVEVWPSLKPDPVPDSDAWDLAPIDVEAKDSPVAQLAQRLATQIQGWIGRATLPGHDTPVKAGDVMILLPRREPFGSAIIRELKLRGVPVAGADRITLSEQIAVMDLIALGRFTLLPEDDYNLAVLLRSPFCTVSEEELFTLSHGRDRVPLWQVLQKRHAETASFAEAFAFLSEMRGLADFKPPYEFYAHALVARDMRRRLLNRLGQEASDAIDEFLLLCFTYEESNTPSLEGFLHWIERGGAEIKRDMERGRDEVRVMTVHGAKGLEADIVILPDTTRMPGAGADRGNLLYTEDGVLFPLADADAPERVRAAKLAAKARMLEEHRRLLYVALTRARDRLIVCGFEGARGVAEGSWYQLAQNAAQEVGVALERGGETIHVLGDVEDRLIAPAAAPAKVELPKPAWLTEPAPRERVTPRLIRPSDASDEDEPAILSPLDARGAARFRRGLLVHAMLAHLPAIAPDKRLTKALNFLRARAVEGDTAEALAAETLAVLDDPAFAAAFGPGSKAEIGLVADLPELGEGARVNGRIDRLAVSDRSVLIVDFKTNRPPPESEAAVARLYVTQMALYRAAASKIFPDRRIACALVWTEGPRLMPLSDALLDAEILQIVKRLAPH